MIGAFPWAPVCGASSGAWLKRSGCPGQPTEARRGFTLILLPVPGELRMRGAAANRTVAYPVETCATSTSRSCSASTEWRNSQPTT
jgi:hypothetical protein